ncbi:MAG: replication-relaxation family protein [Armatimonadota bacterium]|nr:replication-relaxation family protein [Armatimonadota bacterium]
MKLTDRDGELIETVALHGAASRRQLMARGYFKSVSRANRRLRQLFDCNYLRRTHVASGPYCLETVYLLGPKGVAVVAESAITNRVELSRHSQRPPQRTFLEHHLGVLSLRIALELTPAGTHLKEFLTEPECRHEYEIVKGMRRIKRVIKPDGFAAVKFREHHYFFFIEYDRGNCSLPQMRGVFERYAAYKREGAFQSVYNEDTFDVLVVTTAGNRRIDHLVAVAKSCGINVRFATMEDINAVGFYGPVWVDYLRGTKGRLFQVISEDRRA